MGTHVSDIALESLVLQVSDRQTGRFRDLHEYLALFPGGEEEVSGEPLAGAGPEPLAPMPACLGNYPSWER